LIITRANEFFDENFKLLIKTQLWHSPLHTQSALNYYRQRPADEGNTVNDCSFILQWENEPVIAFSGATVEGNGKIGLLAYEAPCISIENNAKLTTKAGKIFLKEFDKITEGFTGLIKYRDFLMDGKLSILSTHLFRKGAIARPMFSKIADLIEDEATLKSNIRKRYRSLINWGLRNMKIQIFDQSDITWEKMNLFRLLHLREAGRETRSEESWRRQEEMVLAGEAFVIFGSLDNKLVSAGFFMHSDTNCFYGVSASRRDMFEKPLFHALMWTAILHAKKSGYRWFEMGEQVYPNHPHDDPPSKKELGISEFKAGFGGQTRMLLDLKLDCNGGNPNA